MHFSESPTPFPSSYYQRFHDLRKEFSALVPGLPPSPAVRGEEGEAEAVEEGGVDSMLTALGLAADASPDLALRRVRNMALVLQRLLEGEGGLHEAEPVLLSLEPGIRSRSEQVSRRRGAGQKCKNDWSMKSFSVEEGAKLGLG